MTTAPSPQQYAVPSRQERPQVPYEGLFVSPTYTDGLPYDQDDDEGDDSE